MAQYSMGVTEEQSARDSGSWAVGSVLLLDMDYCNTGDWPMSERFAFDFNAVEMYATVVANV